MFLKSISTQRSLELRVLMGLVGEFLTVQYADVGHPAYSCSRRRLFHIRTVHEQSANSDYAPDSRAVPAFTLVYKSVSLCTDGNGEDSYRETERL
jgi:hypothetical protein